MMSPYEIKIVNGLVGDPMVLLKSKKSGDHLLIDLGSLDNLSHKEVLKARHIFVSHTHVDHFIGFDTLLRFNIPYRKNVYIYGPKGISKNVQAKCLSYTWNLIDSDQLPFYIKEDAGDDKRLHQYFCGKANDFNLSNEGDVAERTLCTLSDGTTVVPFSLDHNGIMSVAYQFCYPKQMRVDRNALVRRVFLQVRGSQVFSRK